VDRRQARRFALDVPVVFRWSTEGQTACEGAGFSRDISTTGVFVITLSAAPPLFCKLDIMVLLPSLDAKAAGLRLRSQGIVVRVVPVRGGVGMGIASSFGEFDRSDLSACSLPDEITETLRSRKP
jgi:hypothetical protein